MCLHNAHIYTRILFILIFTLHINLLLLLPSLDSALSQMEPESSSSQVMPPSFCMILSLFDFASWKTLRCSCHSIFECIYILLLIDALPLLCLIFHADSSSNTSVFFCTGFRTFLHPDVVPISSRCLLPVSSTSFFSSSTFSSLFFLLLLSSPTCVCVLLLSLVM